MHATRLTAFSALQATRPHVKRGTRLKLDDFMLYQGFDGVEVERERERAEKIAAAFRAYNKRIKAKRGNPR